MRNPFGVLFERRSGAIASSWDLLQHLVRGYSTVAGADVTEATSLNIAAVWTGLQIRSVLLATLPIDVIEYVSDNVREPRPTHPVARLLAKPNAWQTRSEFIGMLEVHRLLRGNCYAWKNVVVEGRNDDGSPRMRVLELIPMHPDQVEAKEPKDWTQPTEYVLHRKNGERVELPPGEVLHVKNMTTNGRVGRGFMSDLKETLGGSIALQEHANALWSRDATPSVVLTHPGTIGGPGSKGVKGLEESFEDIYGRGKDKRRVAVLEEGMGIEKLSLAPEEGQFLETKQDLRAELAAALQLPPYMMGLSEKQTSWGTGIEQQQIGLQVFTVTPSAVTYEQRFNRDLIALPERFGVKFNVRGSMRGDTRAQAEAFWMYRQMGVYSANDIRRLLDENPVPNGDVYLQPTNLAPLGFIPAGASKGAEA